MLVTVGHTKMWKQNLSLSLFPAVLSHITLHCNYLWFHSSSQLDIRNNEDLKPSISFPGATSLYLSTPVTVEDGTTRKIKSASMDVFEYYLTPFSLLCLLQIITTCFCIAFSSSQTRCHHLHWSASGAFIIPEAFFNCEETFRDQNLEKSLIGLQIRRELTNFWLFPHSLETKGAWNKGLVLQIKGQYQDVLEQNPRLLALLSLFKLIQEEKTLKDPANPKPSGEAWQWLPECLWFAKQRIFSLGTCCVHVYSGQIKVSLHWLILSALPVSSIFSCFFF